MRLSRGPACPLLARVAKVGYALAFSDIMALCLRSSSSGDTSSLCVDTGVERALAAGGTLKRPVEDQFYGDRSGAVVDPFGHVWHVSTHVEDVPHEEMQRRMEKLHGPKK